MSASRYHAFNLNALVSLVPPLGEFEKEVNWIRRRKWALE
jgi:hypothetical protein